MKLNPPASSSDLEAAREIARRLHQRRRREDRPAGEEPAPAPVARKLRPLARRRHLALPRRRRSRHSTTCRASTRPRPTRSHPTRPRPTRPRPTRPRPTRPRRRDRADAKPPDEEAFSVEEPSPALEEPGLGDEGPALEASRHSRTSPSGDQPEIQVEERAVSPEEMVGSPEPPPFASEPSPFDVAMDDAGDATESAPPPSWDDVTDACLGLAQARGALLADPSARSSRLAESGRAGPTAIAAKLVSMMNRTLKDAPTRSISAPLMGMHLTAWRVRSSRAW